ncbi:MAG: hypothetical protein WCL10_20330 [Novosphingobium sp.]|uniref:hypothetical protein n=1 Tax=Novosphingobium sp. TaxID=1874826 RepID=UPI003019A25C
MSNEPGWDAKAIGEIAADHYGNFTKMFEHHDWPERGQDMMRKVQMHVKEQYGSIAAFVEHHKASQ